MLLNKLKQLGVESAMILKRDLGKGEHTNTVRLRLYKQKAVFRTIKTEIDTYQEQFEIRKESLNDLYNQLRQYFQRSNKTLVKVLQPDKVAFLERRLCSMIDEVEEEYPKSFESLDSLRKGFEEHSKRLLLVFLGFLKYLRKNLQEDAHKKRVAVHNWRWDIHDRLVSCTEQIWPRLHLIRSTSHEPLLADAKSNWEGLQLGTEKGFCQVQPVYENQYKTPTSSKFVSKRKCLQRKLSLTVARQGWRCGPYPIDDDGTQDSHIAQFEFLQTELVSVRRAKDKQHHLSIQINNVLARTYQASSTLAKIGLLGRTVGSPVTTRCSKVEEYKSKWLQALNSLEIELAAD